MEEKLISLCMVFPPQKQNDVHDRVAFVYLQRPQQLFFHLYILSAPYKLVHAASGTV